MPLLLAASPSSLVSAGPSALLLWASPAEGRAAGACGGDSGGPMLDAASRVVALSVWSTGQGRARCGGLSQGLLLAPQRAFIDGVLGRWGRAASWSP